MEPIVKYHCIFCDTHLFMVQELKVSYIIPKIQVNQGTKWTICDGLSEETKRYHNKLPRASEITQMTQLNIVQGWIIRTYYSKALQYAAKLLRQLPFYLLPCKSQQLAPVSLQKRTQEVS